MSSLQTVPSEIWEIILDYVLEQHEPSVRAFACTSRWGHDLALRHIYRTIKITPVQPLDTFATVSHAMFKKLKRLDSLRHVRCLVVVDKAEEWTANNRRPLHSMESFHGYDAKAMIPVDQFHDQHLHGALDSYYNFSVSITTPGEAGRASHHKLWEPLAGLVKKLTGLTDLVFLCEDEFPRCVLKMLHNRRPTCQLHLSNFSIRCSNMSGTDPYAFQLATSPCLYSLSTEYHGAFPSGYHEFLDYRAYQREAVMLLASGLAPNLKELTLGVSLRMFSPQDLHLIRPLPPWNGFTQLPEPPTRRGSLRCLRLVNVGLIVREEIDCWQRSVDFEALQVLKLEGHLTAEVLQYLLTTAEFSSLRTLTLTNLGSWRNHPSAAIFPAVVTDFLRKIPPLSALTLSDWYAKIRIASFVPYHGPRIRELKLLQYFGAELRAKDLAVIANHCPKLEVLDLTIQRTQGDTDEVKLYRTLGSLPRLKSLTLQLDVAHHNFTVDDKGELVQRPPPLWDGSDRYTPVGAHEDGGGSCTEGDIRLRLINCAIDAPLARSIFTTISSGKPKQSVPLESLTLRITGKYWFGRGVVCPNQVRAVIGYMSLPWHVSRSIRDDRRDELSVVQVPCPDSLMVPVRLKPYLQRIWRRVWPNNIADDWRCDWRGIPLASMDA